MTITKSLSEEPARSVRSVHYEPPDMPELTPRVELALLVRVLHRQGWDDGLAGHATVLQDDGSILINPFELAWDEVRASDIVEMDTEGNKISGRYNISPAVELHLALRRVRSDVRVIVHNHPSWGVVWSDCKRVPPIYDQTGAQIPHELKLVDEYGGQFNDREDAERVAELFGDAKWGLLANHGTLVTGDSIAVAWFRAYTLDWRCKRAWEVEALGGGHLFDPEMVESYGTKMEQFGSPQWWHSTLRREIRRDPSVLE